MSLRSDLLCRNGCGFFGNPEWQWFCSKCWREHLQKNRQKQPSLNSPAVPPPPHTPAGDSRRGGLPFHPFGAAHSTQSKSPKRSKSNAASLVNKKQTLDQNIKQIFQKGGRFGTKGSPEKSLSRSKSSAAASKTASPAFAKKSLVLSPEAKAVSAEFAEFLNLRLERSGVADVSLHVRGMIDKIGSFLEKEQEVEDLSSAIQEFYQDFQRRLESKQQFQALSQEDVVKILDYAERYIMLSCYKYLFCPPISNDEEKDLELQNKIRSLNWISTKDLNCTIDESSQSVRDLLFEAINDILEMDGKMAPQDKMSCLVRCSKKIFDMLQLSNESPASADDFLPCLIYVCLKANPPRVQSNINFITRFCNENKVRMGEAGYFFANLCCAMSFIENMTAESVNMDPEEFESYVSGKAVPPGSWRTSLLMCEGLQQMSQNLKMLSELKADHETILGKAAKLHEEMATFQRDIEDEVSAVRERTKYEIRRAKPKQEQQQQPVPPDAELESDLDAKELLPPPLTPQNVATTATDSGSKVNLMEDYLNNSNADTLSIASFDQLNASIASTTNAEPPEPPQADAGGQPAYRGFSAQSCQIRSISCDNSILDTTSPATSSSSSSPTNASGTPPSSTSSSSPMVSAAASVSTPEQVSQDS